MDGIAPALVTPFDEAGAVDERRLRRLVEWVEARGADFLVPCGTTGEAELLTPDERARVVATVVEAATVPVLAGTGRPGLRLTLDATARAADAGADAALVVTPFYYDHDRETVAAYYREVADEASIPVYLYAVPSHTGVRLAPETVGDLSEHDNVAGMKDSAGDLASLSLARAATAGADFDLLLGHGGVLAHGLAAGADGAVLALSNVAPEAVTIVAERWQRGEEAAARERSADLVALNRAITSEYGVPGLKYAMRQRGAPAGHPRRPHRPLDDPAAREHLDYLVAALEAGDGSR